MRDVRGGADRVHSCLPPPAVQTPGASVTLSYDGGTLTSASVIAVATGSTNVAAAVVAPTPHVYAYTLANTSSNPNYIAAGPDGNMWFTEYTANQIGMITPSGTITEYPTPAGSGPDGIASSNGYLWFTEYNNSASPQVAQIIPAAR